MRDSYERFFSQNYLNKEEFFDFGISETIYVDFETAAQEWEVLKAKIITNEPVYIRGFGRGGTGTHLFQNFYRILTGNSNVHRDSTNNAEPTKLLRKWTGYSKSGGRGFKLIRNYQISHVFGRTKNVYCFTAPWNVVYVPKIIDPFTGHEAKGDFVDEFTKMFQRQCYAKFRDLIDDYNALMTSNDFVDEIVTSKKLMEASKDIDEKTFAKFVKAIKFEFSPIVIDV